MSILVLGLGNTIMTDDGFGVKVVTTLSSRYRFQGAVKLLDGGTLGLDLLPHLEEIESAADRRCPRDAADPGQDLPPRRARRCRAPLPASSRSTRWGCRTCWRSPNCRGIVPRKLVVWGVQPECIEMGTELTATVAAAVEPVVARVLGGAAGVGDQLRSAASAQ